MISGLVLAAGAGSRFTGGPKQLARFRGRPLLEWAISAQCAVAALERVVVVLGARAEEILAAVELGRAEPVVCAAWAQGLSASLKTGIQTLGESDRVIVTLGDQPLMTAALIERFVHEPPGTRAVYHGRPGHPVVLGRDQLQAIEVLRGDRGALRTLAGGREIECSALAPGADVDIDTPADLDR